MAAIVNAPLSGLTVTYEGVQFGGSESEHKSIPPTYSFSGTFVYDDSRRAIKGTRYVLTVSTIFYESNELNVALNMADAESRLGRHGGTLTIEGLGSGFDGAYTPSDDIAWGPKPISVECQPFGNIAWSCVWTVEFFIKQCVRNSKTSPAPNHSPLTFAAFNFDTSWQNDYEGLCTRTIAGHVEIAIERNAANNLPLFVADNVRDFINVIVPYGFRRTSNVWRETMSKERLEFITVDEAMPGDPLPPGMSLADGEVTYSSGGYNPGGPSEGFNKATETMSVSLKVAPDKPRGLAFQTFLSMVVTKHNALVSKNPSPAVVLPGGIYMRQGKFNRAREFNGSFTWYMTKGVNQMMQASGLWEPISIDGTPLTYDLWRTSIGNLWDNRGLKIANQGLRSLAEEAVVVDLCSNVGYMTIGATPSARIDNQQAPTIKNFVCPNVPADGGWIGHDLRLSLYREDQQTWHKKALPYTPQPGQTSQDNGTSPTVKTGGPNYDQSQDEQQHAVEHHGYPVMYVLLQFKGLRMKHKPVMPELKTVGGNPVHLVKQQVPAPRLAFDVLTCPAWFINGYRIYRVNGNVQSIFPTESLTSGAAPNGNKQVY